MDREQFVDQVNRGQRLLVVGDWLSYLLGCQMLDRCRRYAVDPETDPQLEALLPSGYRRIPHN